jgi:hypothetical protein
MKKTTRIITLAGALCALALSSGCLGLTFGGGNHPAPPPPLPTLGQQLLDLQKAKDAGAITEVEFEAQKAKLLDSRVPAHD